MIRALLLALLLLPAIAQAKLVYRDSSGQDWESPAAALAAAGVFFCSNVTCGEQGSFPRTWYDKCGPSCGSGTAPEVVNPGTAGSSWSAKQWMVCRSKQWSTDTTATVCGSSSYTAAGTIVFVEDTCADKKGQTASAGYYDQGTSVNTNPTFRVCSGGCTAWFSGDTGVGSKLVQGTKHYYALGQYTWVNESCTASAGEVAPPQFATMPEEDTCANSQYRGTFNGKTVCVNATQGTNDGASLSGASGDKVTKTSTTTVTGSDGTRTEIETKVTSNGDGSSSTTATYTNYDSHGRQTSQSSKTIGNDGSMDPPSKSGSGSGGTGTGSTSETDCQRDPEIAGCSKFGEPDEGPDLPNQDKPLSLSTFGNFGPSDASCPPPATVSVLGQSVAVDYSIYCNGFGSLRYVVLAVCGFLAATIFVGGFRS